MSICPGDPACCGVSGSVLYSSIPIPCEINVELDRSGTSKVRAAERLCNKLSKSMIFGLCMDGQGGVGLYPSPEKVRERN